MRLSKWFIAALCCFVFGMLFFVWGIIPDFYSARVSEEEFCETHPEYAAYVAEVSQRFPWIDPSEHKEQFMTTAELDAIEREDNFRFCVLFAGTILVCCALFLMIPVPSDLMVEQDIRATKGDV